MTWRTVAYSAWVASVAILAIALAIQVSRLI